MQELLNIALPTLSICNVGERRFAALPYHVIVDHNGVVVVVGCSILCQPCMILEIWIIAEHHSPKSPKWDTSMQSGKVKCVIAMAGGSGTKRVSGMGKTNTFHS